MQAVSKFIDRDQVLSHGRAIDSGLWLECPQPPTHIQSGLDTHLVLETLLRTHALQLLDEQWARHPTPLVPQLVGTYEDAGGQALLRQARGRPLLPG